MSWALEENGHNLRSLDRINIMNEMNIWGQISLETRRRRSLLEHGHSRKKEIWKARGMLGKNYHE